MGVLNGTDKAHPHTLEETNRGKIFIRIIPFLRRTFIQVLEALLLANNLF